MSKYRKKPIIVDAESYHEELEDGFILEEYLKDKIYKNKETLISFLLKDVTEVPEFFTEEELNRVVYPYISTSEGIMYIPKGGYIVTGIKGERYPVKKDIFEETYEKVED